LFRLFACYLQKNNKRSGLESVIDRRGRSRIRDQSGVTLNKAIPWASL